jgi:hypothetical protein
MPNAKRCPVQLGPEELQALARYTQTLSEERGRRVTRREAVAALLALAGVSCDPVRVVAS